MALWKENTNAKPSSILPAADIKEPERSDFTPRPVEIAPSYESSVQKTQAAPMQAPKESIIASDLTIEGKIEGAGSVRIAGKFKGDVNVQGDLTIESGARLAGSVIANLVVVAGELEGNIEGATRVDLQQTGIITGDVKAGSLTVASGARMRGQAVFGWKDEQAKSGKSDNAEKSSSS
jgi:cytoskeletal protein CcmA (bactofilin family)